MTETEYADTFAVGPGPDRELSGAARGVDRLRDLAYGGDTAWHPVPPFVPPAAPAVERCPGCGYLTGTIGHRIECADA